LKGNSVYRIGSLENALERIVAEVKSKGELNGYEVSRTCNAWRDHAKRLWILDKAREHGVDFRVEGFSCPGKPIMTLFVTK
jgi:hypothetical protein